MTRFAIALSAAVLVTALGLDAFAFRCGSKLVREGDSSFVVKASCGEPADREIVGYTLTARGKRELKIEKWMYGPKNGRIYILTFEGGVLRDIQSAAAD